MKTLKMVHNNKKNFKKSTSGYIMKEGHSSFETLVRSGSPCCPIEDTSALLGQNPRSPLLGTAWV